jgi:hypothetical protein
LVNFLSRKSLWHRRFTEDMSAAILPGRVRPALEKKTCEELIVIARKCGARGYSNLKKPQLVDLLLGVDAVTLMPILELTWWARHKKKVFEGIAILGGLATLASILPRPNISLSDLRERFNWTSESTSDASPLVEIDNSEPWPGERKIEGVRDEQSEKVVVYPVRCEGGPADGLWFPLLEHPEQSLAHDVRPLFSVMDVVRHDLTPSEQFGAMTPEALDRLKSSLGDKKYFYHSVRVDDLKMEASRVGVYRLKDTDDRSRYVLQYDSAHDLSFGSEVTLVVTEDTTLEMPCVDGPMAGKSIPLIKSLRESTLVWVPDISRTPNANGPFYSVGESLRQRKYLLVQLCAYRRDGAQLKYVATAKAEDFLEVTTGSDLDRDKAERITHASR